MMLTNKRKRLAKQPTVLKYPSEQEGMIWLKRRQGTAPSEIADELDVTRAYVSKALRKAERKIELLLDHAAKINRVKLHHMSSENGLAVGYCAAYKSETIISYSPKIGIQVWFDHRGDCDSCADFGECATLISSLSNEWAVPIARNAGPVDVVNDLFTAIMKRLEWKD
ncbi:MAG: hypothetical protein ACFFED_10930 [Candidatus Thorarchaeota archaeon]